MKTADLKENFYMFGNKGNVWNNTSHIAQVNTFSGTTLCGTPMLSTNHSKHVKIEHIGCEECLKIYFIIEAHAGSIGIKNTDNSSF